MQGVSGAAHLFLRAVFTQTETEHCNDLVTCWSWIFAVVIHIQDLPASPGSSWSPVVRGAQREVAENAIETKRKKIEKKIEEKKKEM